MRIRSNIISVTVLTGVFLLASCGSSDSSSNSGPTISKADFIAKADAICTSGFGSIDNAQTALGAAPTAEQFSTFMTDVFVPAVGDTISKMRDLGFPAGDEALLGGLLDDGEKVLADINKDPASFTATSDNPFAKVDAGFQDYGLIVCGG
jgi:hypothetical protein